MESSILAHGSDIDELLIFMWPVIFGIGFWLIIRKKDDEPDEHPPEQP